MNIGLFLLWYFDGQGFPQFPFVIIFWGLGVAARGVTHFRHTNRFDRMADSEYRKMLDKDY